jgi:hypothetical protein
MVMPLSASSAYVSMSSTSPDTSWAMVPAAATSKSVKVDFPEKQRMHSPMQVAPQYDNFQHKTSSYQTSKGFTLLNQPATIYNLGDEDKLHTMIDMGNHKHIPDIVFFVHNPPQLV